MSQQRAEPEHPISHQQLLDQLPPHHSIELSELATAVDRGPRVVALDDDPTGSQPVADLPVLTTWSTADLRWALREPTAGFFVLTNTRSLSASDAAARNREVVDALEKASRAEGISYVLASRSDSTLRGHFPLETDVLQERCAHHGRPVDGLVLVPAFPAAGRITAHAVHWTVDQSGALTPVGETEFARDATFGYVNSDLRAWVAEKTTGRCPAEQVDTVTIDDLRNGGPDRVAELLSDLHDGRPVVVDAVDDTDLRVLALGVLRAEERGAHLVYRVGPSFVRARTGQPKHEPVSDQKLDDLTERGNGLIVVGSHVGLTTAQLSALRQEHDVAEFELDVPTLLDDETRDRHIANTAARAASALARRDVVLTTSRDLVTGDDAEHSLAIARSISAGLVGTVRSTVRTQRPSFVVAKGGITSSDVATDGLDIHRAMVRGTMLPGIISLWESVSGEFTGMPYVVFPGNVGDESALADVIARLRGRCA